jgi:phage gp46-like protein
MPLIDYKIYLVPSITGHYFSFLMGSGDAQITTFIDSAILISYGTNQRVTDIDRTDNGWWGEALLGKNIGSKLYLLDRSKVTDQTLTKAEDYALESIQWLVDEGYLSEITSVTAQDEGPEGISITTVYKTIGNEIRKHYYIFGSTGAN